MEGQGDEAKGHGNKEEPYTRRSHNSCGNEKKGAAARGGATPHGTTLTQAAAARRSHKLRYHPVVPTFSTRYAAGRPQISLTHFQAAKTTCQGGAVKLGATLMGRARRSHTPTRRSRHLTHFQAGAKQERIGQGEVKQEQGGGSTGWCLAIRVPFVGTGTRCMGTGTGGYAYAYGYTRIRLTCAVSSNISLSSRAFQAGGQIPVTRVSSSKTRNRIFNFTKILTFIAIYDIIYIEKGTKEIKNNKKIIKICFFAPFFT